MPEEDWFFLHYGDGFVMYKRRKVRRKIVPEASATAATTVSC